ncbi:beta-lactamase domain protein, partial [Nannochloropsis gaditana CCMP526]
MRGSLPPSPCPAVVRDVEDIVAMPLVSDTQHFGSVAILDSCTGCTTCRVLAPDIFLEARRTSRDPTIFTEVAGRPLRSMEEAEQVREAVMACPVHAVKWVKRPKALKARPLTEVYPKLLDENVYVGGPPSKKLFGGASYLIVGQGNKRGRNILVDTPDPEEALVDRVRALGGLDYIIFTHIDHVSLHRAWKEAFPNVQRVMHADDFNDDTQDFEIKLQGGKTARTADGGIHDAAPPLVCSLPGWEDELELIHGPGHTPGSIYVLYKEKFLCTGDSLHYSRAVGHLVGFRLQCWESWSRQQTSWRRLLRHSSAFSWVLPGHGEPHRFPTPGEARESLAAAIQWALGFPDGRTPSRRFRLWATTRVTSRRKWLRWLADNLVLPPGSRLAIPCYAGPAGAVLEGGGGPGSGLGAMLQSLCKIDRGTGVALGLTSFVLGVVVGVG